MNFVSSVVLASDEVLVSFDVVSLFPTKLAIDVAHRRLEKDETLSDRTTLTVDNIIVLLDLCLKATYLMYRGCYYQQIIGTAMGSPVSVTVANLVMEEIEERALSTFDPPPRTPPPHFMNTEPLPPTFDTLSLPREPGELQ